jgi:twitching motility protein PilT
MRLYDQPSVYPCDLDALLRLATEHKSSDLHLVVGMPPCLRVEGSMTPCDLAALAPQDVQKLLFDVLTQEQIAELTSRWELDFSHSIPGCARFRGNVILQRGTLAAVFRVVPFEVPRLAELGLPPDVERLCSLPRGLILITGPTGSGKSTTMAAIINRINEARAVNVVTIEDPIEFLHTHKKATVRQREVGTDTHSFSVALRQSLRHDPDVIMIGEMRDLESISIALTAAETGHLVLSTLHTQTAPLSVSRIVDSFSHDAKQQVRQQLSGSLRAVISQQLVPTADGRRAAAVEYMVDSASVRSMIREGREHQLYGAIQTARAQGMQTMDQALADLLLQGRITLSTLLQYAVDQKEAQRLAQGAF